MQIAIVGTGFGGLGMAMRLVKAGIRSFTIFERGSDVGGTWRENTYPGAACDIPSHLYSFSFEPKADWPRTYSEQPAILDYLRGCMKKYGLEKHIRFGTEVVGARFDESANDWHLELGDGSTFCADVLVAACGQLNVPSMPAIDGRDSFAGPAFHSARWRHDVDLTGKRVAVIGTGASAIQFVPRIAERAASLTLYQRSAPYVIAKPDRAYDATALAAFRWLPFARQLNRFVKYVKQEINVIAFSYFKPMMAIPRSAFEKLLAAQIPDGVLREKLTPDYTMGCKRILLSNDYYPALMRDNVDVLTDAIERITPAGIRSVDGTEREFDAIVYGTGFASHGFLSPMGVTGRDGRELGEAWRDGAHAYLGISVSGFPNLFMIYGPNTNLGHNSIIFMIEAQLAFVLDAIERLSKAPQARLEVRPEREAAFNEQVQQRLAQSVWATGCGSWYLTATGKNPNNWPDFTFSYRARTRKVDPNDFLPLHA